MKYSVYCALIGMTSAISIHEEPDVYGKNGEGYKNVDPTQAMSKIGIDVKTQGTGDKCKETDWATINWKGTLTNGEVVTDSLSEGTGPKTFTVGRDEVFKCWDLAVQQL
jgi:FKBP-type peptidyl-prolyl cis-trans isomerase